MTFTPALALTLTLGHSLTYSCILTRILKFTLTYIRNKRSVGDVGTVIVEW